MSPSLISNWLRERRPLSEPFGKLDVVYLFMCYLKRCFISIWLSARAAFWDMVCSFRHATVPHSSSEGGSDVPQSSLLSAINKAEQELRGEISRLQISGISTVKLFPTHSKLLVSRPACLISEDYKIKKSVKSVIMCGSPHFQISQEFKIL